MITNLRMDMIGKVEHCRTHRELEKITFWREDKHLVFIEVHLELIHSLESLRTLEHGTDIRQPLVKTTFALHALITPMGSDATLCDFIHALSTNLYFHPLLLRTKNRDV